jgi:hypothetical protein
VQIAQQGYQKLKRVQTTNNLAAYLAEVSRPDFPIRFSPMSLPTLFPPNGHAAKV